MEYKTYLVGGAVRDQLLHRHYNERDYVVVGASEAQMLAQGYIKVGQSFPVFLHPQTKEEYALARKEFKRSSGHQGFSFDVSSTITIEEDLLRRDLTINAIAQELDTGKLIDPYNGLGDLHHKVLRHVSKHFVEDPLRVLRVARFAAQLQDFKVAKETIELMKQVSLSGELETLSGERVFQELVKALNSDAPWIFFEVLDQCDALIILFPEIKKLQGVPQKAKYHPEGDAYIHTIKAIQKICTLSNKPTLRFATLFHDIGKGTTPLEVLPSHKGHEQRGLELIPAIKQRLKPPKEYLELCMLVMEHHLNIHRVAKQTPQNILSTIKKCHALKRQELFEEILLCAQADNSAKLQESYPQRTFYLELIKKIKDIKCTDLQLKFSGAKLGEAIDERYLEVISQELVIFQRNNS